MILLRFRRAHEVGELLSVRRHAWRRSAFRKPGDQLSEVEAAWRRMFVSLDELLKKTLGAQRKIKIDSMEFQELDLGVIRRMLEYRERCQPVESRAGAVIFWSALVVASLAGWLLARSLLLAAALGAASAAAALLAAVTIFQDQWSSHKLAVYLRKVGRLLGSTRLEDVGARLIETNCLHAQEYYQTGDPARAADSLRSLDQRLLAQNTVLEEVVSLLRSEDYKQSARVPEEALVRDPAPNDDRLERARVLLNTIGRYRNEALGRVDWANKECEEELFELERQITGLANGSRRHEFETWYQSAKNEYFNGRVITNIIRNWFDMDAGIASEIVGRDGGVDFTLRVEPVAETFAQIEMLESLWAERRSLRAKHEATKRELFGAIG